MSCLSVVVVLPRQQLNLHSHASSDQWTDRPNMNESESITPTCTNRPNMIQSEPMVLMSCLSGVIIVNHGNKLSLTEHSNHMLPSEPYECVCHVLVKNMYPILGCE